MSDKATATSGSGSSNWPNSDPESNTDELSDDCDRLEEADDVESVLPKELDESEIQSKLVGVNASDCDEIDWGSIITGVKAGRGVSA